MGEQPVGHIDLIWLVLQVFDVSFHILHLWVRIGDFTVKPSDPHLEIVQIETMFEKGYIKGKRMFVVFWMSYNS